MEKRASRFVAVFLLLVSLATVPLMAQKTKKIKIGVSMAAYSFTFVTYLLEGMKIFEKAHPEIQVTYVDAKNDANNQLGQVESFINEEYNAIILMPVDAKMTKPMVTACNAAKIPLISLNRKFENADTFVGTDGVQGGRKMAEQMVKLSGGKGNAAIMHGLMGQESEVMRTRGIREVLTNQPGIKVVLEGAADWDRAKGLVLVENWIQSGTPFRMIFGESDEMAIGAYKAVAAAQKRSSYIIGGIDGGPAGVEAVKNGDMDFTLFQDPYRQANSSLEAAIKHAKGEKVDKFIIVDYQLVTKENADEFMKIYQVNK